MAAIYNTVLMRIVFRETPGHILLATMGIDFCLKLFES